MGEGLLIETEMTQKTATSPKQTPPWVTFTKPGSRSTVYSLQAVHRKEHVHTKQARWPLFFQAVQQASVSCRRLV